MIFLLGWPIFRGGQFIIPGRTWVKHINHTRFVDRDATSYSHCKPPKHLRSTWKSTNSTYCVMIPFLYQSIDLAGIRWVKIYDLWIFMIQRYWSWRFPYIFCISLGIRPAGGWYQSWSVQANVLSCEEMQQNPDFWWICLVDFLKKSWICLVDLFFAPILIFVSYKYVFFFDIFEKWLMDLVESHTLNNLLVLSQTWAVNRWSDGNVKL